jgi:nicotinamide mononucleotide adenylyltransferase
MTTTKASGERAIGEKQRDKRETLRDVRDFQQNVSYLKRGQENALNIYLNESEASFMLAFYVQSLQIYPRLFFVSL